MIASGCHRGNVGLPGRALAGAGGHAAVRIAAIDMARGAAVLAMIFFHFTRDLELFGLIAAGTTLSGGWAVAARLIARSFLLLSGVSLALAHGHGIRWRASLRRAGTLAAVAALVTGASFIAMPDRFIYFGILHALRLGSFDGVLLTPRPAWVAVMAAGAVTAVWWAWGRALDLPGWLDWSGLAASPRPALDLIPALPWLAPVFLGIACAKLVPLQSGGARQAGVLIWLGRHSLLVYLVHQPLLVSAIWIGVKGLSGRSRDFPCPITGYWVFSKRENNSRISCNGCVRHGR